MPPKGKGKANKAQDKAKSKEAKGKGKDKETKDKGKEKAELRERAEWEKFEWKEELQNANLRQIPIHTGKEPTPKGGLENSPFSTLKPDLRKKIWSFIIHDQDLYDHDIDGNASITVNVGRRRGIPALTRVCKDIRKESLPMYLDNRFIINLPLGEDGFDDIPSCHTERVAMLADFIQIGVEWLNMIPKGTHQDIREVTLHIVGSPGMWEDNRDRWWRTSRFQQLAQSLKVRGFVSPNAQREERLSVEAQFHRVDNDGRCVYEEQATRIAVILQHVGLTAGGVKRQCAGCGVLKADGNPDPDRAHERRPDRVPPSRRGGMMGNVRAPYLPWECVLLNGEVRSGGNWELYAP